MYDQHLPIGVNELAKKKNCRYGSHKKVIIINVRKCYTHKGRNFYISPFCQYLIYEFYETLTLMNIFFCVGYVHIKILFITYKKMHFK